MLSATYDYSPKTKLKMDWRHDVFYLPSTENSLTVQNFSTLTHTLSPSVIYHWTPKTKLRADYDLSFVDYFVGTGNFDSIQNVFGVGIDGNIVSASLQAVVSGVNRALKQQRA